MRISANRHDKGHTLYLAVRHRKVEVFVDGVLQRNVIVADNVEGYVQRYKVDENGRLVQLGSTFDYEEVFGKVTIEVDGEVCGI